MALGYTLVGSEKRHLLQCIHRDKHDRVTIDSLEHTYVQWRRCLSDHSKDFLYDYAKHVKVLYKMILMNKRIPSVYTVKYYNKNGSFEDYMNTNDTAGCALDENILRNILGQVSIDEQVFDHEDIDPNVCSRVMKEMITYDRRKIGVLEETTQVEEKDFLKFMQFR